MHNVYITIFFHCGPTILANPFILVHPDLPPDAALGQRFERFVVGLNSNGISNQIQISETAKVTLFLNSTVRSLTMLPFHFSTRCQSVQYPMEITQLQSVSLSIIRILCTPGLFLNEHV